MLWPKSVDAEPSAVEAADQKPAASRGKPEPKRETHRAPIDVAAVIDRALQAAGLKK
jgi:hypothetical protein